MKLKVENLGVISKAEVDLSKDLIILTGENNTGKTYLAYMIYYLFERLAINFSDAITSLDYNYQNTDLEINLFKRKSSIANSVSELLSKNLKEKIQDLFSTEKKIFSDLKIIIVLEKEDIEDKAILNLELDILHISKNKKSLFHQKQKGNPLYFISDQPKVKFDHPPFDNFIQIKNLFHSTFIIPAERQGINLFHKELSLIKNKTFDSLLQNGSRIKLFNFLQTRFNKYALPIKDSLEFNQNLDAVKTQKSEFAYLADELDKTFLQGNIKIDDEGDISFKPVNSKKSLDFHLTSSTVKSLSSLSIYLRYVAKKGDFLIIDEPELNLHPDNQRKIARFISRLIYEGFKVMISTHSDYIIRELNSLIMLASGKKKDEDATKKLLKKYKYKDEELLPKEKIGVYLFKQNKPVKKVSVGATGFDISTIDKEVEDLNQSSQDIFFTLFE